jgi:heme exporter protein C
MYSTSTAAKSGMKFLFICVSSLALTAVALIFFVAPTELSMGDVQRILYLHVSVAWFSLTGCLAMAVCGLVYLRQRRLKWDFWSQAWGEVGWLCATLTLVTGAAWAHEAWGTWWTWEPRLTSSFVLWLIFAGIFLVRSAIVDPHQRARISAVLALLGVADVPLVLLATRWFRGVHPVTPEMDPTMKVVLLASVACFSLAFVLLIVERQKQLELAEQIAELEAASEFAP